MPVIIKGQTYYRTLDACRMAKICRATLYRWLKAGIIKEPPKDRRGWRLFTEDDLNRIRAETSRIRTR